MLITRRRPPFCGVDELALDVGVRLSLSVSTVLPVPASTRPPVGGNSFRSLPDSRIPECIQPAASIVVAVVKKRLSSKKEEMISRLMLLLRMLAASKAGVARVS